MTSYTVASATDLDRLAESDPRFGWPNRASAWGDERLNRVGLVSPFERDSALALLVAVGSAGLLAVLLADPSQFGAAGIAPNQVPAAVVAAATQGLLLCLRRVRPGVCLGLIAVLQVALLLLLPLAGMVHTLAPLVAAYTCGVVLPARRTALAVTGAVLCEGAAIVTVGLFPEVTGLVREGALPAAGTASGALVVGQVLSMMLNYLVAVGAGASIATRRRYVELLRVRAAEVVTAQRARADAATGQERARMARELHDIAAHQVSSMVVQAAAVERLVDRDPARARAAAGWVRGQGRETLRNLRLVVGALREPGLGAVDLDGTGAGGAPVPGLASIGRLVRSVQNLGTPVDLRVDGQPRPLPPIADITFYRVAQEALSNACDHAPGALVRILLRYRGSEVSVEVTNATTPPPPGRRTEPPSERRGFGLIGMQERAQLLGARFEAGATPSGQWRVRLALPVEADISETGTPAQA